MKNLSKRELQDTSYDLLLHFKGVIDQKIIKEKDLIDPYNLNYTLSYLSTKFRVGEFKLLN